MKSMKSLVCGIVLLVSSQIMAAPLKIVTVSTHTDTSDFLNVPPNSTVHAPDQQVFASSESHGWIGWRFAGFAYPYSEMRIGIRLFNSEGELIARHVIDTRTNGVSNPAVEWLPPVVGYIKDSPLTVKMLCANYSKPDNRQHLCQARLDLYESEVSQ